MHGWCTCPDINIGWGSMLAFVVILYIWKTAITFERHTTKRLLLLGMYYFQPLGLVIPARCTNLEVSQ